jgi:hypothetical protein
MLDWLPAFWHCRGVGWQQSAKAAQGHQGNDAPLPIRMTERTDMENVTVTVTDEMDNEPIIAETLEEAAFILEDNPGTKVLIDPTWYIRLEKRAVC